MMRPAIHKGPVAGVVADAITLNGHLQNPQNASVQLLQPAWRSSAGSSFQSCEKTGTCTCRGQASSSREYELRLQCKGACLAPVAARVAGRQKEGEIDREEALIVLHLHIQASLAQAAVDGLLQLRHRHPLLALLPSLRTNHAVMSWQERGCRPSAEDTQVATGAVQEQETDCAGLWCHQRPCKPPMTALPFKVPFSCSMQTFGICTKRRHLCCDHVPARHVGVGHESAAPGLGSARGACQ